MHTPIPRMPLIDAVRAPACLLIVLHHLAFYGPMSDLAYPVMPALIDGLYHYGRMAVQAFLVVAGFLSAQALAPEGVAQIAHPWLAIRKRYARLALPYLAALVLAMGSAALAGLWMRHESIPAAPTVAQLLSHVVLLNELLDQEALSAGVWYVGIDFQSFVVMALVLWASWRIAQRLPALRLAGPLAIAALTAASLFHFNLDDYWDETFLYFFAYYGLGCLAYWLSGRLRGALWLVLLAGVVAVSLAVDFRGRIVVAGAVMLLLGLARQYGWFERCAMPGQVRYVARISYSIFLVHFPICLLVNAIVFHFFAQDIGLNIAGMLLAFALSIAGGAAFYRWVESRAPSPRAGLAIMAGFAVCGLAAVLAGGG